MKTLAIIACLIACLANGAEKKNEPAPDLKIPKPLSPTEAAALKAKEKQERDEAMARLPAFDGERLEHIIEVLRGVKYPISFDALRDMLGGSDSLVWCCTRVRLAKDYSKQTSTFSVGASAPEYELVVDYDDYPIGQRPTIVVRARLCYSSPLGWRFTAESMDDCLQVGAPEKKSNQMPAPPSDRGTHR